MNKFNNISIRYTYQKLMIENKLIVSKYIFKIDIIKLTLWLLFLQISHFIVITETRVVIVRDLTLYCQGLQARFGLEILNTYFLIDFAWIGK